MKRTTLKLDDAVLRRLKQQAAAEGRSLQDLANQLLRRGLATTPHIPYALALTGWDAQPQPGVDIRDRDALFDLMNGR
jgi:plasmid stability protein